MWQSDSKRSCAWLREVPVRQQSAAEPCKRNGRVVEVRSGDTASDPVARQVCAERSRRRLASGSGRRRWLDRHFDRPLSKVRRRTRIIAPTRTDRLRAGSAMEFETVLGSGSPIRSVVSEGARRRQAHLKDSYAGSLAIHEPQYLRANPVVVVPCNAGVGAGTGAVILPPPSSPRRSARSPRSPSPRAPAGR